MHGDEARFEHQPKFCPAPRARKALKRARVRVHPLSKRLAELCETKAARRDKWALAGSAVETRARKRRHSPHSHEPRAR
eukprot:12927277-Prorocentrum_lima.AAC.1